ncbi:hypothetical protein GCM10027176_12290 [Actinoallomurus bryophytorum]
MLLDGEPTPADSEPVTVYGGQACSRATSGAMNGIESWDRWAGSITFKNFCAAAEELYGFTEDAAFYGLPELTQMTRRSW